MESLIDKLKQYLNIVKLDERFNSSFKISPNLFSEIEIEELNKVTNTFERNIKLKKVIKDKASGSYDLTNLNFWIVNDWGGIRTFKLELLT